MPPIIESQFGFRLEISTDMWRNVFVTSVRAVTVAVAVVVAQLAVGCASPTDVGPDAGPDAAQTPQGCGCEEEDDEVCSLDRCTSRACAAVESDRTALLGCMFYMAQVGNVTSDAERAESFLVTNPGNDSAAVALQFAQRSPDGRTIWSTLSGATVARTSSGRLSVSGLAVPGAGLFAAAALRVVSNRPITVVSVASDDRTQGEVSSSGGTMVWPVQALGGRYRVMTYPQLETVAVGAVDGGRGGAGRITVVATRATEVTLPPSILALVLATGLEVPPSSRVPMEDGDVLQILSDGDGTDLSGTEIAADKPVAVFSGNLTTSYGRTAPGINSPDMTYEQMPPLEAWGKRYVAAALPPQSGTCDSILGGPGASIWRIVASESQTKITFTGPAGLEGLPSSSIMMDAAGEARELVVRGGSFSLTATAPVLVTQGIDCEPSLSLAISADRFLDDLRFATLPNFDQVAAVVRPVGKAVMFDDAPLDASLFQPAGTGFEVALVPLPSCPSAAGVCTHRLQGKFGLTLRGMDVFGSWALTVPAWQQCTDPDNQNCLD